MRNRPFSLLLAAGAMAYLGAVIVVTTTADRFGSAMILASLIPGVAYITAPLWNRKDRR